MYVPEINEVKDLLESLKTNGLITSWELPYENILTRRSAAIFFLTLAAATDSNISEVCSPLKKFQYFSYRLNNEMKLSKLQYRITFNKEEYDKNSQYAEEGSQV